VRERECEGKYKNIKKIGVENGFCSPYLAWCLTNSKMEREIKNSKSEF